MILYVEIPSFYAHFWFRQIEKNPNFVLSIFSWKMNILNVTDNGNLFCAVYRFSPELPYSPHVCVGFLWPIRFRPTLQKTCIEASVKTWNSHVNVNGWLSLHATFDALLPGCIMVGYLTNWLFWLISTGNISNRKRGSVYLFYNFFGMIVFILYFTENVSLIYSYKGWFVYLLNCRWCRQGVYLGVAVICTTAWNAHYKFHLPVELFVGKSLTTCGMTPQLNAIKRLPLF